MSFVHLNSHSHYSLLDALGAPKDIVKQAKQLGFSAIGLTDNSYLYGAVEFYKAAKDEGLKAIIGVDFYLAPASRFDRQNSVEAKASRLTVFAKNFTGYQNLLQLSTLASTEGFYYRPRLDMEILEKYKEGLIVLSGSIWGAIPQALLQQDLEQAETLAKKFQQLFGEDFYLEVQRHPEIPEYQQIEPELIKLSQKLNIPLVATQSSHYLKPEDHFPHDILVSIGTQTNIHNPDRKQYKGDFSLKPAEEMLAIFKDLPDAIENTVKIADKCDLKLQFGQNLIPPFKTPNGQTSTEYLRELCEKGLKELYPAEMHEKAQKQLDYELEVVGKMGFNDYFLIVWDFIDYAKRNGIAVGPGRGSAAGAIIAYTLKITELDPLKYGLIFERFLNPDRVSMPDIDIDFADHRRHEVLDYTIQKYGKDCVSQVITYGTMSAKAAVRDVGRGMGYPYSEVDAVAKAVPQPVLGKHAPLKVSTEKDPELSQLYKNDARAKELLDNSMKLEGTVRNAGTHACAVIISEQPLVNYTPLQKATDGSDGIVTQYSMKYLEDIGLLKMDFLGLKNLTIIEQTLNLIEKTKGIKIDLIKIPMDDLKTFELFQRGDTTGIFQLESSGMRRYIRELKPDNFEDIIAMISLYRPGPMEWIPSYIKGKHHPDTVRFLDPSFESILKVTNGVAIYQEQILLIARNFAGFSLGEADILRRAVGKKDPKLLVEQKEKFIDGSVAQGHDRKHAKEIFEKVVEPFAGYGFNKSHAACYAMISYRTSYLKAHYPTEFMAALLTSDHGNLEKIAIEINDCDAMGIEVLPPSINFSESTFSVESEGKIRFGLSAIKGIGEGPISEILKARAEKGPFQSVEDIASRLPPKILNKKTIESLAYSGALDQFGDRRTFAENFEEISRYAKNASQQKSAPADQSDLFQLFDSDNQPEIALEKLTLPPVAPLSTMEKLKLEKNYLGLYVSMHPLKGLTTYLKRKAKLIGDLNDKDLNKNVKLAGIITSLKTVMTKAGTPMAYGELEDLTSKIEIVIFPKVYEQYKFKLKEDQILFLDGKLDIRRGSPQLSVFDLKNASLETMVKNATEAGVYDPQEKIEKKSPRFTTATEAPAASVEAPAQPAGNPFLEKDKITISIPTEFPAEKLTQLKQLMSDHVGSLPVFLKVVQNGQLTTIKTQIAIDPAPEVLAKFKKLLGE
ncbi:MAG: DNA polymerase III subunit alpha [Candidatus Altimarinota bacterium]